MFPRIHSFNVLKALRERVVAYAELYSYLSYRIIENQFIGKKCLYTLANYTDSAYFVLMLLSVDHIKEDLIFEVIPDKEAFNKGFERYSVTLENIEIGVFASWGEILERVYSIYEY